MLKKKTIIITGGNKGIGYCITNAFAQQQYDVFVGARTDENLSTKIGDNVYFVPTDVREEADHIKLVNYAIQKTGRLDAYINNAGYSKWKKIEDIDNGFLDDLLATNLKGVFWGCKAALKVMKSGGSIVNISSIAGKRGSANNTAYCASKFGVNGLTQSLAKEVGKKNIRVNAICPVMVPTQGLLEVLGEEPSPATGNVEAFIENFRNSQAALPNLPSGEDIANTCLFLTSNSAASITGQCINVDCGVFPQ